MSDPRTLRTRSALQRAVVELASAQDPSSVTVASLTQAAGINRATFYDHYDSPQEVLLEVLREDLDRARQHDLELRDASDGPRGEIFRATMADVLDHVRRFRPVYEQSVRSPVDSTLTRAVSSHFVESISGILARQAVLPGGWMRRSRRPASATRCWAASGCGCTGTICRMRSLPTPSPPACRCGGASCGSGSRCRARPEAEDLPSLNATCWLNHGCQIVS